MQPFDSLRACITRSTITPAATGRGRLRAAGARFRTMPHDAAIVSISTIPRIQNAPPASFHDAAAFHMALQLQLICGMVKKGVIIWRSHGVHTGIETKAGEALLFFLNSFISLCQLVQPISVSTYHVFPVGLSRIAREPGNLACGWSTPGIAFLNLSLTPPQWHGTRALAPRHLLRFAIS